MGEGRGIVERGVGGWMRGTPQRHCAQHHLIPQMVHCPSRDSISEVPCAKKVISKEDLFLEKGEKKKNLAGRKLSDEKKTKNYSGHTDILAQEQHQDTKAPLQGLLCVSDDSERQDLLGVFLRWLLLLPGLSVLDIIQLECLFALPSGPFDSWISVLRNASLVGCDREN